MPAAAVIDDDEGNYIGRVFELDDGWYINLEDLAMIEDIKVRTLIQEAKSKLTRYPNRKGAEFPEDMSIGAISLWLLEKGE